MARKRKKRDAERPGGNLVLVFIVALFVVLLMIRMLAFVAGHGRHRF